MPTAANPTTAEQLEKMPSDGKRYELVNGELRMMSPAGGQHGRIAMKIGRMLGNYVAENNLGEVFAAETGFLVSTNPDTVRAPDAAYVNTAAFEQLEEVHGFLPVAPDLVVEVVSPSDTSSEVEEKANSWIGYGVGLALVVDPGNHSIRAYRKRGVIQTYFTGDTVDASDVVAGWKFAVDEVF